MTNRIKLKTTVYTDGATVGHNGKLGTVSEVGVGVYIKSVLIVDECSKGTEVITTIYHKEIKEGISNNEAEFKALIEGMKLCIKLKMNKGKVVFKSDSMIVVNRANGNSVSCQNQRMCDFQDEVFELIEEFEDIDFQWIPREQNEIADRLSKEACKLQL